jgi:hypothetical protein
MTQSGPTPADLDALRRRIRNTIATGNTAAQKDLLATLDRSYEPDPGLLGLLPLVSKEFWAATRQDSVVTSMRDMDYLVC